MVKAGAVVVGLGKSAVAVADALRAALKHRAQPGVDWEESRVNHLVLVVECSPLNGDSCEAAQKFMRDVRKSDGYPVYSEIIGRKVAILAIGKQGKVPGAAKVEEVLLKRGGCARLLSTPGVGCTTANANVASLPWVSKVCEALDKITEDTHGGWPEQAKTPAAAAPVKTPAAAAPVKTPAAAAPDKTPAAAAPVVAAAPTAPAQAPPPAHVPGPKAEEPAAGHSGAVLVAVLAAALLVGCVAVARARR